MNGSSGAGLQPQQLCDWSTAALVKVQSCDPLHVSDPRLMEPHVILHPDRFLLCALATKNTFYVSLKVKVHDHVTPFTFICFLLIKINLEERQTSFQELVADTKSRKCKE